LKRFCERAIAHLLDPLVSHALESSKRRGDARSLLRNSDFQVKTTDARLDGDPLSGAKLMASGGDHARLKTGNERIERFRTE